MKTVSDLAAQRLSSPEGAVLPVALTHLVDQPHGVDCVTCGGVPVAIGFSKDICGGEVCEVVGRILDMLDFPYEFRRNTNWVCEDDRFRPDRLRCARIAELQKTDLGIILDGRSPYCLQGWWPLIKEAYEEVKAIDPGAHSFVAKEKYARLEVWCQPSDVNDNRLWEAMNKTFGRYRVKSTSICEECGAPGGWRQIEHWEYTLCDYCTSLRDKTS